MAMLSNNEIKKIKSLSQKKFRDDLGLFVVEGDKLVEEALLSGFEVVNVYRRDEIGEAAMGRISTLSTPPPSLAVVRMPKEFRKYHHSSDNKNQHPKPVGNENVSEGKVGGREYVGNETEKKTDGENPIGKKDGSIIMPSKGLVLGLDSIRDPGNLGTILRAADWFGIRDVYASEDTADIFNPKVVQATMGAVFRVRMHYCDLVGVSSEINAVGGRVYGTFLDGKDIYSTDLDCGQNSPVMIVIGNEARGISPEVAAAVTDKILIPSYGHSRCESLNAATAAAIVIAEFRRRG